jgi:hypothetical protein
MVLYGMVSKYQVVPPLPLAYGSIKQRSRQFIFLDLSCFVVFKTFNSDGLFRLYFSEREKKKLFLRPWSFVFGDETDRHQSGRGTKQNTTTTAAAE